MGNIFIYLKNDTNYIFQNIFLFIFPNKQYADFKVFFNFQIFNGIRKTIKLFLFKNIFAL
ncbi:MAG: hypothetical protein EA393_04470 [Bacteroidetes bacterium]|nr:MAG: hypothetical protein EA393_04470 [Bacteroidota bacterium]